MIKKKKKKGNTGEAEQDYFFYFSKKFSFTVLEGASLSLFNTVRVRVDTVARRREQWQTVDWTWTTEATS